MIINGISTNLKKLKQIMQLKFIIVIKVYLLFFIGLRFYLKIGMSLMIIVSIQEIVIMIIVIFFVMYFWQKNGFLMVMNFFIVTFIKLNMEICVSIITMEFVNIYFR